MNKVDPISNSTISYWKKLRQEADEVENVITDRIDYILHFIFNFEKAKLHSWYFEGASEGEIGNLGSYLGSDGTIYSIVTDGSNFSGYSYILKDGTRWSYEGILPYRWLFEDFESELIEGKQKFDEKEKLRKLQLKEKKEKKKQKEALRSVEDSKMMSELKQKLSPEELGVLKRNL